MSLHIPDRVRAELEVEVEGGEIEVEVEFKWSMAGHDAAPRTADLTASADKARPPNRPRKSPRTSKARKR